MTPLETVQFILWWTSGCVLFAAVMVTPFIIVRTSLRLIQKDAVLRYIGNRLHDIGWRQEGGDGELDTFFIEPRRGFGIARTMFLAVIAWRSYGQQNKSLYDLLRDSYFGKKKP